MYNYKAPWRSTDAAVYYIEAWIWVEFNWKVNSLLTIANSTAPPSTLWACKDGLGGHV